MEGALSLFPHSPFPHSKSLPLYSSWISSEKRSGNPGFLHPRKKTQKPISAYERSGNPGFLDERKKTHKPNFERVGNQGLLDPRKKTQKLNSGVSPHRAVAAVRLLRIEQGGAFAGLLNEKGRNAGENEMVYVERTLGFRTRGLDDRDIRLVTDIVGGTIRWKRYLDHLIMALCHEERVFRDMEPLLLQILRIGFYEIIKLGMPPYAVVDENVRLAKVALRPGAGNLVNGILRRLVPLKERDSLPLPKVEGDERAQARALAIIHSHPVWMVRRWTKFLGQSATLKLLAWNNSDPCFSLSHF